MSYAVFDWDNTVRRGFTLFQWTDYLCEKGIVDCDLNAELKIISLAYKNGNISHDDYAQKACEKYAQYLKGMTPEQLGACLPVYMQEDERMIFQYVRAVMDFLNENDIDIIVISGSPEFVLKQYKSRFDIKEVYAMASEVRNGLYTGKVAYNYGCKKQEVIQKLVEEYGDVPLYGFGDSDSDIPILVTARNGFYIASSQTRLNLNNDRLIVLSDESAAESVVEKMKARMIG